MWRDGFAGDRFQAGGVKPALHLAVGEAEPAMREIRAQEFEIVRREIRDQKPRAGAHHTRRFGDGRAGIVEIVQDLME